MNKTARTATRSCMAARWFGTQSGHPTFSSPLGVAALDIVNKESHYGDLRQCELTVNAPE
jgi:hypothetical protein